MPHHLPQSHHVQSLQTWKNSPLLHLNFQPVETATYRDALIVDMLGMKQKKRLVLVVLLPYVLLVGHEYVE